MRAVAALFVIGCAATPPPVEPVAPIEATSPLHLIEASLDLDGAAVGSSGARATIAIVFASWCGHCRKELDVLAELRAAHPNVRVLGLNYRGHEEYARRGSADAVRRYVAEHAPWLRVVPAGEELFTALGRPPKVPTILIYDRAGRMVARYDRRERPMPGVGELADVLRRVDHL